MNRRWMALTFVALTTATLAGCTMCQCPDDSYGYYGGLYQRTDPVHGRAGSIITGASGEIAADEGEIIDEGPTDEGPYYDEVEE